MNHSAKNNKNNNEYFDEYYHLEEQEYRYKLFQKTLTRCSRKSVKYIGRSRYLKMANVAFVLSMIVLSSVLGVLLAVEGGDYILATISFSITFLQLVHQGFKIGTLGVYYRYAGLHINKLQRTLIRKMRDIRDGEDIGEIDRIVDNINEELDDLNLLLFSQGYGPSNVSASGGEGELSTENEKADLPEK